MKHVLCLVAASSLLPLFATTYYADSRTGNDAADGRSPETAWQSLAKINAAKLKPGDTMLFARGSAWRGQLFSCSGAPGRPVTYSAYGTGPKPAFLGSLDWSGPANWVPAGDGLWATRNPAGDEGAPLADFAHGRWVPSFQGEVRGTMTNLTENGETFYRIHCTRRPKDARDSHLQVWGPILRNPPPAMTVTLKVRSSKPMRLETCEALLPAKPWSFVHTGGFQTDGLAIGPEWRTVRALLRAEKEENAVCSFHFKLGDLVSDGSDFDFIPVSCTPTEYDRTCDFGRDIGIVICNHGETWGFRRWSKPELVNDLDYWFSPGEMRVYLRSQENPGTRFSSVELAKTWTVIGHGNRHDLVWNALEVKYTGGFAFSGGNTRNVTIRNCDLNWIGGGLQYWRTDPDGTRTPVRYGNGVEFWSPSRSNAVERCRIWQVYDAALTPQTSKSPHPIHDLVFRDNVIWQAEYSYEYWDHDPRSFTANIVFEHNTCVDAGSCWSHNQRPNPNGAHVMCYANQAPSSNIVFRNNVFCRTTDRGIRMWDDWRQSLVTENNLFWNPENTVYLWEGAPLPWSVRQTNQVERTFGAGPAEFTRYQKTMKIDLTSVYGEPQFVDEAKRDYRLRPGTIGTALATDGGPVGARNMPGLDGDQSLER